VRFAILLLLLPGLAAAQFIPRASATSSSTGNACSLASSSLAFASHYRATTATNLVPGFQCDALLASCVKFGPGIETGVGTNALGETIFGRTGTDLGVWRFWGTVATRYVTATTLAGASDVTATLWLSFGTNGAMRNLNNKPVLVDTTYGFQNKCRASLGATCGSSNAPESTAISVCGTGGARTQDCVCTYDGSAYLWINRFNPSDRTGTTTSCPAT
jgi:hypothetical protein